MKKNKKRNLSLVDYLKSKNKTTYKKKYIKKHPKRALFFKNFAITPTISKNLNLQKKSKTMKKTLLKKRIQRKRKFNKSKNAFNFMKNNDLINDKLNFALTRKFAFKLYNYKFKLRQKINFYNAALFKTK